MTRTVVACLVVLSALLSGCPVDRSYLFVEGFETVCDGAPCLWSVQPGMDGAARWNETLPGEHGVLLEGSPMAIVRDMSDVTLLGAVDSSTLSVEMAAICEGDVTLTVELTIELLATGTEQIFVADFSPPSEWDGDLDVRTLVSDDGGFGVPFRTILGLRVVKVGEGNCELDYLSIRSIATGFR